MFAALWVCTTWGDISMESVIFVMTNPVQGTESDIIVALIFKCIIPVVLLFSASIFAYFKWVRIKSKDEEAVNKKRLKRYKRFVRTLVLSGVLFSAIGIYALWNKVDLGGYLKGIMSDSSFIEDNYADPNMVDIKFPEKKRNLIYIFMESMEVTYADKASGGNEEENLIPHLSDMMKENYSFSGDDGKLSGARSMYGTDWTMGGTFAETSGLPLIIPIRNNSMDLQESFFPSTRTMGDILEDNGYRNIYLIGSDVEFGGRKLYYSTHGHYEVEDYNYAREKGRIPDDYMVFWGYEDEKLYQFAREDLTELGKADEPFCLTMLTVDTHFDDGYKCRLCEDKHEDQYKDVISCADRQVSEFVKWCQQQDFYENTTIVICGDHPTMDNDYCKRTDDDFPRRVVCNVINPAEKCITEDYDPGKKREYTTFDLFPTTVSALGAEIEGDRLGLGTDLFSGKETFLEKYGYDKFNEELRGSSKYMYKLADVTEVSETEAYEKIDDELREALVDITLKETKEGISVEACLQSETPSCMHYIRRVYVKVEDGSNIGEFPLRKDGEETLELGNTTYSLDIKLPLLEDTSLRQNSFIENLTDGEDNTQDVVEDSEKESKKNAEKDAEEEPLKASGNERKEFHGRVKVTAFLVARDGTVIEKESKELEL